MMNTTQIIVSSNYLQNSIFKGRVETLLTLSRTQQVMKLVRLMILMCSLKRVQDLLPKYDCRLVYGLCLLL